jgi:septal ring-binding cell division protein DamX
MSGSTSTTRVTLKSTNLRIDSLDSKLDAILAALSPEAPAKAPRKAATRKVTRKPVARKAPARKAPAKKVALRPLSKKSRVAFVAAARKEGVDFSGQSTKAIAEFCVTEGYAPKGFTIGAGYTALFS